MLNADERSCVARLEAWHATIEQLLAMFDAQGRVPRKVLDEARTAYRELTPGLAAECRSGANSRRRPPRTAAEKRWYYWVIHEGSVNLPARVDSVPEWSVRSLHEAEADFSGALSALTVRL